MALNEAAHDVLLGALDITQVSLHSASPGAGGTANELSGGGYARQNITYAAASGASRAASNQPAFSVGAGSTVSFVGFWAAAAFRGDVDVVDETFAGAGTYTITSSTVSLAAA